MLSVQMGVYFAGSRYSKTSYIALGFSYSATSLVSSVDFLAFFFFLTTIYIILKTYLSPLLQLSQPLIESLPFRL